jgi:hypothetical protein
MITSLEVKVLYQPDGGEGLAKRKGVIREGGSEESVEQNREPMNKNRIGGERDQASGPKFTKPISIKGLGRKSGGCAGKASNLTSGDLYRCPWRQKPTGTGPAEREPNAMQKSAEGIVGEGGAR